jgi:glycosyltransferase involved in cell wall biosynthesis
MGCWIDRYATAGVAASKQAAAALFGSQWERDPRHRVLFCGIDLDAFRAEAPTHLRAELGIPPDALVIGHAGRMMEQKNHRFLIEIAAALLVREPRTYFLLVGDGPLRPALELQVRAAKLESRVLFTGARPDVPDLMRSVMDVFLLPSLYEGLPLVGMEALAAGVPMVLSDAITPDLDVIPELVHRLSLSQSAQAWAERISAIAAAPRPLGREAALARVAAGPFNIDAGVRELAGLYRRQLAAAVGNDPQEVASGLPPAMRV